MNLDPDLLFYVALLVLFIWRSFSPWRCCGKWVEYLNYVTLLYALMLVLLIVEVVSLTRAAMQEQEDHPILSSDVRWLRFMMFSTPAAFVMIMVLSWRQTREHVEKIKNRRADVQHDRAVMIIALPVVYGLLSVSSIVRIFALAVHGTPGASMMELERNATTQGGSEDMLEVGFARYETCFLVGDLYEAWALFQFGTLTLEVIGKVIEQRHGPSTGSQEPIGMSYLAVSSIMWLGTMLFVVTCVVQAGWSLWQWNFKDAASNYEQYEKDLRQFTFAGLLTSGAAIYNVHTVEHTFAAMIDTYAPFLKFLSVKFLVFFSFWQRHLLDAAQTFNLLKMSKLQVNVLHSSLMVYECLLSAILHSQAWRAEEDWYNLFKRDEEKDERTPIAQTAA